MYASTLRNAEKWNLSAETTLEGLTSLKMPRIRSGFFLVRKHAPTVRGLSLARSKL